MASWRRPVGLSAMVAIGLGGLAVVIVTLNGGNPTFIDALVASHRHGVGDRWNRRDRDVASPTGRASPPAVDSVNQPPAAVEGSTGQGVAVWSEGASYAGPGGVWINRER